MTKVNQLKSANDQALSGNTNSSTANSFEQSGSSTTSSSTTPAASSSSASSSKLTAAEKKAAKNYKGKNEYTVTKKDTELNGKVISNSQINQARKSISKAGVDANAMSDQDVRNVIKGAHNKNQSINQYVKKNYK